MHRLMSRMMNKYTPKMNEQVMRGLATEQLKYFEEYVDAQIRSICAGMPAAVKYIGYRRCSPEEEFEISTKPKNTRRMFELAPTSKYMVTLEFEFTDALGVIHKLDRPIYYPFCREGGLFDIAGTEMHFVPVLSDKVFTPGQDSIFVRLVQDRNNIFRTYHTVKINGKRESRYVAHAEIYRSSAKNKVQSHEKTTRAKQVLSHYLLARYGFDGAFQRYAGITPEVGDDRTITSETHPPETWMVYESTGVQPKKTNIDKYWDPASIRVRIAIKRSEWSTAAECLIVGFYYVVDHFPERFRPKVRADLYSRTATFPTPYEEALVEFQAGGPATHPEYGDLNLELEKTRTLLQREYHSIVNDAALWRILIGHIRFSGSYQENRLLASINEHFETIEAYLDQAVQTKLRESNIYLENYFDLLNYVQVNFERFIAQNERNGLNVNGKSLEILQYVAYDILFGITMMKFKINKAAAREGPLTLRDVTEPLRRTVKMGSIFHLGKGNKLVCETVSYGGDHMYPKVTSIVAQQENRAGGGRGGERRTSAGPEHRLDLSMVFAGSILNLPKSDPTPVVRVNPFINMDLKTGTVLANEKFADLIKKYEHLFRA